MVAHIFGDAQPTMPDPAVDGNLEGYLPQQQQQQSAQATVQQAQVTKQQAQAIDQHEHDRLIQSLPQSNDAELATTASPGPSGLFCLNNTMRPTCESVASNDLRATAVDLQPRPHSVSVNGDLLTTAGSKLKSESSMLVNQTQSIQDSKTQGRHQPSQSAVCMSPCPPTSMAGQGGALRVRRKGVYGLAKTPVLSDGEEDPMELAGWCADLEPVSPSNTIELV